MPADELTFISFLTSDRDSCFSRMRTAVEVRTGLWSRHDRSNGRLAQQGQPAPVIR